MLPPTDAPQTDASLADALTFLSKASRSTGNLIINTLFEALLLLPPALYQRILEALVFSSLKHFGRSQNLSNYILYTPVVQRCAA